MVIPFPYESSLSCALNEFLKTCVEALHIGSIALDSVDTYALIERRRGKEVDPRLWICLKSSKYIGSNNKATLRHIR